MIFRLRLLAAALLLLATIFRSPLLGSAAFMLIGATLITAWWTGRTERGLRVRHVVAPAVSFGEATRVTIEVTNTSLLPIAWLQVADSVPLALRTTPPIRVAFPLGAGGTRQLTYHIKGTRRGFYHLGPLRLVTGDVLGLYVRRLVAPPAEVTVLPRVLPLHDLGLPAQLPFGPLRSRSRRGEDPARPAGVRPYQAGDGMRRLDWKSSARVGELMVRRAEPTIAPETTLALAFRQSDFPSRVVQDALERAAVAAASLGAALLARKLPVGLVCNGADPKNPGRAVTLPPGKGDGHLQMLLGLLGRLEPGGDGPPLLDLLQREALPWGGTLALIIANLEPELVGPIAALRRRGQHVVLVLLESTPDGIARAHAQRLDTLPVDARGAPLQRQA